MQSYVVSFVDQQINLLINSAPSTLDTLGQIAANLANDTNSINAIISGQTATNAAVVTANVAMLSYVNAQDALLQSGITGANAAIVTANTAVVSYVNAQDAVITSAWQANASAQQTQINTLLTEVYANANVAAYLPTNSTIIAINANSASNTSNINLLNANVTAANASIQTLNANVGGFYTWANAHYNTGSPSSLTNGSYSFTLQPQGYLTVPTSTYGTAQMFSTAGITFDIGTLDSGNFWQFRPGGIIQFPDTTQQTTAYPGLSILNSVNANVTAANASIQTLNANVGSFYTWANLNYGTSSYANANVTAYLLGNVTTGNLNIGSTLQIHTLDNSIGTTNGSGITFNSRLNLYGSAVGLGLYVSNPVSFGSNLSVGNFSNATTFFGTNVYGTNFLFPNGVSILSTVAPSSTYSNANVASYLPVYNGNIVTNIITANNITSYGYVSTNSVFAATIGNTGATLTGTTGSFGGNVTAGNVQATGFYWANGAPFVSGGIQTSIANGTSSVAFASAGGSGIVQIGGVQTLTLGQSLTSMIGSISASGNVSATDLIAYNYVSTGSVYAATIGNSGATLTGTTGSFSGNVTAGNVIANLYGTQYGNTVGTTAVYTGNVSANYFVGNGSALTGLQYSSVGNIVGSSANVTLVAGSYQTIFDNTGNITLPNSANVYINGTYPNGNLMLNPPGTGDVYITPPTQLYAQNTTNATNTGTGAVVVAGGIGVGGNVFAGNVLATGFFYANGTPFTSSNYGNTQVAAYLVANPQAGTYSNANVASYLPTYAGNIVSNIITANNITSYGYVSTNSVYAATIGNTGATLTGTLSTAAQTNITSVGTLTALTVTGNITAGNINATQYGNTVGTTATYSSVVTAGNIITTNGIFWANGTAYSSGSGGGGGSSTQIVNGGSQIAIASSGGNAVVQIGGVQTATFSQTSISMIGSISATGNVYSGNIVTTGTTSGNISGANVISANTFQVSSGIFWANGVAWSSAGGGTIYSNANVTSYLPVYSGNIGTSGVTTTNVIATFYGNLYGNLIGTQYGNTVGTTASYTGNISAGNIVGTSSNVTFVAGAYTSVWDTTGNLTVSGNVIANNFYGNLNLTGNVVGNVANVTLQAGTYSWTFDNTGNVTLPNIANPWINSVYPNGNITINTVGPGTIIMDGNTRIVGGNLFVANAGGVYGTAPAYSTGTWTPSLTATTTAPTVTYSSQTGYWTKTGNMVFVNGYINLSAVSAQGSGTLQVTGLPFTALDEMVLFNFSATDALTNYYSTGNPGITQIYGHGGQGNSINFRGAGPGKSTTDLQCGSLGTGYILFSCYYRTQA
jgi:hypothetical protein